MNYILFGCTHVTIIANISKFEYKFVLPLLPLGNGRTGFNYYYLIKGMTKLGLIGQILLT